MSVIHEIVILANSVKKGNMCVAGKDIRTKEWIRPVSTKNGGALSTKQALIWNHYGSYIAKPLQKAYIEFSAHVPLASQPENFLIKGNAPWQQHYKLDRGQLNSFVDTPEHLWDYGPVQDRVDSAYFDSGSREDHQSLYLVKVETIKLKVVHGYGGKKKIVGKFVYNNKKYTFSITDPNYSKYREKEVGFTYKEYDRFLCLSFSDDFYGYSYKLIAAIL